MPPIECTSHDVCPVSPLQDCCRNFSFACGMEQRNEAASNHASLLTCSFLFRALARHQPPAGLIETAMERERYVHVNPGKLTCNLKITRFQFTWKWFHLDKETTDVLQMCFFNKPLKKNARFSNGRNLAGCRSLGRL